MQHTNASKTVRVPSLIDTLSQGFAAVNRRLWVLLIPLALDLFYWFGPRQSTQPLIDAFLALTQAVNPQLPAEQIGQVRQVLNGAAAPVDLSPFAVLPGLLPKFINIVSPVITLPTPPLTPPVWYIGSVGALFLGLLATTLISMLATALYLALMVEAIQPEIRAERRWLHFAKVYGSFLAITLLLVGLSLAVYLPLAIVGALIAQVNVGVGYVIVLFGTALLFWMLFTTSFAFDAVVISRAGPLRALLTSLLLVQRSFRGAFGLLALGWLILAGMRLVWQPIATSEPGVLLAMIGSAYLSSGLTAAHLIFFRDRLSRVQARA